MAEEVLANFSAMLDSLDFAQELALLNIPKLHFRQRKKAVRELRAMTIGLWRLALERSFPRDEETFFERFLLSLHEQSASGKKKEEADAFDLLARAYVDRFKERGDSDFTGVSEHIVALFFKKGDLASPRLKLALLMRDSYTTIFRHLI